MRIDSVSSLISYLTTQGAEILGVYGNSVRVTEDLFLVVEDGWVIPTGYDNGWLYQFTNDITNLFINYLFE